MYKLDRTAFSKGKSMQHSFHQADYWWNKSFEERLSAVLFLIAQVYQFPNEEFPVWIELGFLCVKDRTMAKLDLPIDFKDFIQALNKCKVEYMLVGGYAVVYHGYVRTTGDIDIWVDRTAQNYHQLVLAFAVFGMPVFDMTLSNFLNVNQFDVFTFGVPPMAIDLMTQVKGLNFDQVSENKIIEQIDEDFFINIIPYDDLIRAKEAAGRNKDLGDLDYLRNRKSE